MSSIMRARNGLTGRSEVSEVIGALSRAEGCWTFDARDRMPRQSRATAHHLGENAPTATRTPSRERVRSTTQTGPPLRAGTISVSSNGELGHHAGILMLQNVTVRHVGRIEARRVGEAHKNLGRATGRDRRDILPSGPLGFRRVTVLRYDLELAAVDVHGMQHSIAAFPDPPAQELVSRGGKDLLNKREGLAIHAVRRQLARSREG